MAHAPAHRSHKTVSAAAAVSRIRPGARVFVGSACGEPLELVRALGAAGQRLTDTELVQVLTLGVAPYADPQFARNVRANAFFIGKSLREAVNDARADYTPVFLSRVPELFRTGRVDLDVALVMVSPPDRHGYCSMGVSVDITKSAVEAARLVIAQVNRHMPRTLGDSFLHVDQIDLFVEHDEPLTEWRSSGEPDETTQRIARNVARLVPDGATLQLGIGRMPDAVLALLGSKNDLGIHTEMFSDSVMRLARAGVINGSRKTLQRGKIVGSFVAGSQALFEFVDDNPLIEMHPSDYTNALAVIRQQDVMIAINAAIEADLTGQVVADSIGEWFYSGIGGHADFIRGAALSRGGRPIIAMPSTARTPQGVRSRIVAHLSPGAGVATTRGDSHYIVTEYGVAYLHGRSLRERAIALINLAHPDFREDLLAAAKRRKLVYADQMLPPVRQPYPSQYESAVALRDGSTVFIRPIRPDDETSMREMFYSFSERTRYLRFHGMPKSFPHAQLQVFCNVDYDEEMALIAIAGEPENEEVVAVGRYLREPSRNRAEMAFAVRDDWQNKGLGTTLFGKLVDIGRERGVDEFWAEVLAENIPMIRVFRHAKCDVTTRVFGDAVRVTVRVRGEAGGEPRVPNSG